MMCYNDSMKPREIFDMQPQEVTHDIACLVGCYYDHIPEVGGLYDFATTICERVSIRVIKHHDYDHRRFWRLCAVMFDGEPIMIIRNAGREGDDHHSRFIVDTKGYAAMVGCIAAMPRKPGKLSAGEEVDIDQDIPDLVSFYGNTLGGCFERH